MVVFAIDAGVRRIARFVPRVFRELRAIAASETHEQIFFEDKLLARIIGSGVHAGIHADGVAGARFHAEAAKHAPELVDHEPHGIALVASTRIANGIFAGFDVNALGWARRRTAKTRDAAGRAVFAVREAMYAAKALRIRTSLLGIRDRIHAVADAVKDRIVPLPEGHLLRVAKEMGHGDPEAAGNFRDVRLNAGPSLRARDGRSDDFSGTESWCLAHLRNPSQAPIRAERVPPAMTANFAEVLDKTRRCSAGASRKRTNTMTATMPETGDEELRSGRRRCRARA